MQISADTGLGIVGDSAEATFDINDITIGRPEKGWQVEFFMHVGEKLKFVISEVMEDRIVGIYQLKLGVVSSHGLGRRVLRQSKGGI